MKNITEGKIVAQGMKFAIVASRFNDFISSKLVEGALDALGEIAKRAGASGGKGLAFLMERSSSPSRARLQKLIADKFDEGE